MIIVGPFWQKMLGAHSGACIKVLTSGKYIPFPQGVGLSKLGPTLFSSFKTRKEQLLTRVVSVSSYQNSSYLWGSFPLVWAFFPTNASFFST